MAALRVWIDPFSSEEPRVLAWKNECFYCGKSTETDRTVWEERLRDARDPAQVMGTGCQVAPIQIVTRVEVDVGGEARIYYGKTGMSEIKFLIGPDAQELVNVVKESRPNWRHDMRKQ